MSYQYINYQIESHIALITLQRPDVLNSFNQQMGQELQAALQESSTNNLVRSLIITGAGKAFCAGQDLAEVMPNSKNQPATLGEIVEKCYNPIILAIRNIEKPVICALNGIAAGAGANIALACDFVIAAASACFIQSFSKIGLIPDSGGTFFLPRLVGLSRATALTMLGEKLTAQDAFNIGLIYKIVAHDKLLESASTLAQQLTNYPTKSLGLIKQALNASFNNSLQAQLTLERDLQTQAGNTADYAEGVKAFLEKRKPNFKGN